MTPSCQSAEVEDYRYYLRAAVLVGVLDGAFLGALALVQIAVWGYTGVMPAGRWSQALIQAHGDAQLYGWIGLFVIGVAGHSLPRMTGQAPPPSGLARGIFVLVLGGLTLGLLAQPLAAVDGRIAPLFPAAMALQWAGVTLFTGYVLRTLRWPKEPYLAFVFAGTLWLWLGAGARFWLSLRALSNPAMLPPAAGNAAYLHAMTWGFLVAYLVGYSLRLLPAFVGLPAGCARPAWAALALLTAGAMLEVAARARGIASLSLAATLVTALGVGCAVVALRLGSRPLASGGRGEVWLRRYALAAYGWLALAVLLLLGLRAAGAAAPLSPLHEHAFSGAARHALTVGFASLLMIGVAWRILPIFSGSAPPHPACLPVVLTLLLVGGCLRVWGQIAAGLWGGAWYGVMGISGWPELAAVVLFATDVLRLLKGTPERAALPDAGAPVVLALDAPVGPLVAHRPWLVPVFARHGMGQVSNPIFQRTVGQRVTIAQACRRFNVKASSFLEELAAADRGSASATA